ncbi:MAG: hypothetical protein OXC96_03505 [Cyanobacteria bacterium MAG CAR1_bin_15]|nr:hypothetical protein [Cyanobacteria bacterium MAG CAR1_bin_15]
MCVFPSPNGFSVSVPISLLLIFGAALLVSCDSGDQKLPKDVGLQIGELVGISDWDFEESSYSDGECTIRGDFTYNVTAEQPVTGLVGGEILYNAANGGISTITGFVSRGKGLVNGYISEFYTEDACDYSSSSEIKIESVKYLYFEPAAITIPASDP